jgi:hypothetical protein
MNLQQLVAGDTLDFVDTVAAYPPADGWTLKYRLVPRFTTPTQAPITLTAATSGTDYRVQVGPSGTGWAPGDYTWARWVEKSGARVSLGEGMLEVLADPSTIVAGYDPRTHGRKVLESIEAVIEGRATLDQQSYAINGRQLVRTPLADLLRMRDTYRAEVRREDDAAKAAAGLATSRHYYVRAGRA